MILTSIIEQSLLHFVLFCFVLLFNHNLNPKPYLYHGRSQHCYPTTDRASESPVKRRKNVSTAKEVEWVIGGHMGALAVGWL